METTLSPLQRADFVFRNDCQAQVWAEPHSLSSLFCLQSNYMSYKKREPASLLRTERARANCFDYFPNQRQINKASFYWFSVVALSTTTGRSIWGFCSQIYIHASFAHENQNMLLKYSVRHSEVYYATIFDDWVMFCFFSVIRILLAHRA